MDLQIKFIQESFEQIKPRVEELATGFYANLFQDYPALRPLLSPTPMDKRKRLLIAALVQVVQNLENPVFLGEYLGRMGERLARLGLRAEQIECFGPPLLKSLQEVLGQNWTPACEQQWRLSFEVVAALLRQGLQRSTASEANVVPMRRGESQPEQQAASRSARSTVKKVS